MITTCPKCQAKQQADVKHLKGKTAKFQCPDCGNLYKVDIPSHDTETAAKKASVPGKAHPAERTARTGESGSAGQPTEQKDILTDRPKLAGFSIKTKLTFVIVALTIISLTIVSSIASFKGEEILSQQAQNHLKLISGQKAKEYNNVFSRLQNELEGIAIFAKNTFSQSALPQSLDFRILMPWTGEKYGNQILRQTLKEEIVALKHFGFGIQGLVQKNPYITVGYMATPNNVMVLDDESTVGVIEAEDAFIPTERPWYIDATIKGGTIWTQPYVDVNTKKLITSCATPVYNNKNELLGVVSLDILLNTIQKDILKLDIGYDSQAFLLGKDGSFLVKPGMTDTQSAWNQAVKADNALDTDNMEFKQIITSMLAGNSGVGQNKENGINTIVSYAPIPALNASLGIVISEQEVLKPAKDIRKIIIGVWAAVVLISLLIGYAIGNGITRPINELSRKADLMSQGKTDLAEITSKRKDEIGLLIESYNRLIVSLKLAMSRKRR